MRRLVCIALLLASSSAFAGPMISATTLNSSVSHSVMAHRGVAARPMHQIYRFTQFKYGLLKWCKTGPREAEQGDLTF